MSRGWVRGVRTHPCSSSCSLLYICIKQHRCGYHHYLQPEICTVWNYVYIDFLKCETKQVMLTHAQKTADVKIQLQKFKGLNFGQSSAKYAWRNTQNDCHQWLSDSSRVHQIRFRCWGSLRHSPRPRSRLGRGNPLPIPHPLDDLASRHSTPSASRIRRLRRRRVFVLPLSKVWLRRWTHPCYFFCRRPWFAMAKCVLSVCLSLYHSCTKVFMRNPLERLFFRTLLPEFNLFYYFIFVIYLFYYFKNYMY